MEYNYIVCCIPTLALSKSGFGYNLSSSSEGTPCCKKNLNPKNLTKLQFIIYFNKSDKAVSTFSNPNCCFTSSDMRRPRPLQRLPILPPWVWLNLAKGANVPFSMQAPEA